MKVRNLKDLERRVRALDGEHKVPLTELYSNNFVRRVSNFSSFEELLQAGGYDIKSEADFTAIPDDEWDEHVRANTRFDSWRDMKEEASSEWTAKRLGLR